MQHRSRKAVFFLARPRYSHCSQDLPSEKTRKRKAYLPVLDRPLTSMLLNLPTELWWSRATLGALYLKRTLIAKWSSAGGSCNLKKQGKGVCELHDSDKIKSSNNSTDCIQSVCRYNTYSYQRTSFVFLEFQYCSVHFQALLPSSTNERAPILVTTSEPECNSVLVLTNRDDGSTHFVSIQIQSFTNDSKDCEEPPLIATSTLRVLLGYRQDKLSSVLVLWIFPHRNDTFLEDVVVGVGNQLRGWLQVVEDTPKGLDCVKVPTMRQVVLPVLVGIRKARIVKPHGPFSMEMNGLAGVDFFSNNVGGRHD